MYTRSIVASFIACALAGHAHGQTCAADCDGSGDLTVSDFVCFQAEFAQQSAMADCDRSGSLDVLDFVCFQSAFSGGCDDIVEGGTFPETWINGGPNCPSAGGDEVPIQIHQYNDDLYILRQSLCTNFEAPFMYLIFGEDKVLLQDTGAGGIAIANAVQGVIDEWLARNNKESIELLVTHSHSHGDHVQGDNQFNGLADTTVVGLSQSQVASFYGFADWPNDVVQVDLGGRVVDVIAIPGHQSAAIALYDERTGLLLPGDSLYPGRLFINSDICEFRRSTQRMVDFMQGKPFAWVLGTHVEMSNTPGEQFQIGATWHPDEHPLQLQAQVLDQLLEELIALGNNPPPGPKVFDEFVIFPIGDISCR